MEQAVVKVLEYLSWAFSVVFELCLSITQLYTTLKPFQSLLFGEGIDSQDSSYAVGRVRAQNEPPRRQDRQEKR
jgi:hypothetical protein